jgi:hypothetical protein
MNIMNKSIGAIVILGALAGCAGDESTPPTVAEPSAGQSPAAKPKADAAPIIKPEQPVAKPADDKMEPSNAAPADGKKAGEAPSIEGPSKTETPKPSGAAAKLSAKELAGIKELPQAEQDAAIAQAVCPVSTHKLGSMGKPLKVTAEGRTFYICCDSCEDDVKTKGKEVVAKLDKLKADK